MAELFQAHEDTITDWTQDARVQVHIASGSRARELRIKRRIDAEIEARILGSRIEEMPIDLLIKLRKEMLGGVKGADTDAGDSASADIWSILDRDPKILEDLSDRMNEQ